MCSSDLEDLPDTALGKLLARFGLITEDTRPDLLPPLPVGALGTLFPKPQRCFFQFGEPIRLGHLRGKQASKKALMQVRGETAEQIESMLAQLLRLRARHSGRDGFWRRLLTV